MNSSHRTHSEQRTRRSLLTKAGLVAGGVGVTLLHGSERAVAQTVAETMDIAPPPDNQALRLRPSGNVPPSVSVGGAFNLDNTASTGAGAVLYSNQGAGALGRLLVVNQANPDNPQHAVRIQNSGIAHAVSIFHDPAGGAGDATAEALDVVSTNPLDSTLGIRGCEQGRGTVKITHSKPTGADDNAAALSIALIGAGTGCQGIFIGNSTGDQTTGSLIDVRNGGPGNERLVLTADGGLQLPVQGPGAGVVIGSDANLYRSAPSLLATDGGIQASIVQLPPQATLPEAPETGQQARLYVSTGKLVIEWSDNGRVLYTTLSLDTLGPKYMRTTPTPP